MRQLQSPSLVASIRVFCWESFIAVSCERVAIFVGLLCNVRVSIHVNCCEMARMLLHVTNVVGLLKTCCRNRTFSLQQVHRKSTFAMAFS